MQRLLLAGLIWLSIFSMTWSQAPSYSIHLEPISVSGLGGIQSFAFGQANGKWLVVGGRLDGLHRRQPWAAFDQAGHNTQVWVVDPVLQQSWTAPLTGLPTAIQEQLSSTNMEFYQDGDYLYCIGGYGYSATQADHTTYDGMVAVDLPGAIAAVLNNASLAPHFRRISDARFQVTGGKLKKINQVYHLLGGQKFLGRYNPMGPNQGPGFVQEYTNSIRRFTLTDDGTNLTVNFLPAHTDTAALHRRDYNAEPQIYPDGSEGITMFSGVFQQSVDLPFLDCVNVDSVGYAVHPTFQQLDNHYHCPAIPLYSLSEKEMHTLFFGGIAQYYESNGTLIQDNNVPFVRTIARVSRDSSGTMTEQKLSVEMPSLLGAGAEFIPNLGLPHYPNKVFQLDQMTADTTLLGHIFGGISSTGANIFFTNDGTQSTASSTLFRVYLVRSPSTPRQEPVDQVQLNPVVYPNPGEGEFYLTYHLDHSCPVTLSLMDAQGKILWRRDMGEQTSEAHKVPLSLPGGQQNGTLLLRMDAGTSTVYRKVLIRK